MKLDDLLVAGRLAPPGGHWRAEPGLRDSAILVLLVERDGRDHLVFNRRRDDLPWHPGQVCFPGGARDGAESAVDCALREAREEMGVEPADVALLGRLVDRVSIAGFSVAALVGRVDPATVWRPQAAEVAEVFEVPCERTLEAARWSFRPTANAKARFARIPYFDSGRHVVWGLTGIILRDFVRAVAEFDPPDAGAAGRP
jgi:8-oxo-dGTP pyrophosphatase MutT (NUDIX family)